MQEVIKTLSNLETVEIYEDSIDQIIRYQEFFQYLDELLHINNKKSLESKIYIVDKSKMYRIENVKLSEKKRITLI
jgi:hypothetical protein